MNNCKLKKTEFSINDEALKIIIQSYTREAGVRNLERQLAKLTRKVVTLIEKKEVTEAILQKKGNLKKIIKIVHVEIRKKMNFFLKKNKNKKFVVLDIPLLLENKLNKKKDVLIFVDSKKSDILKKLKKRENFNMKLFNIFRNIQFSSRYKMKKSHFVIKNDFTKKTININIENILRKIKQ